MQTQHVNQPEEKLWTRIPQHATCEATRIQNDEKTSLTRYVKQQEWIMWISPRRHMNQQWNILSRTCVVVLTSDNRCYH